MNTCIRLHREYFLLTFDIDVQGDTGHIIFVSACFSFFLGDYFSEIVQDYNLCQFTPVQDIGKNSTL